MEIERKFLVTNEEYKSQGKHSLISQGYLSSDPNRTVRIRINGEKAFITIKSKTIGISRDEYEYEIPVLDADYMIQHLCERPIIKKYRYIVNYQDSIWEIDEFLEENEGLIIAEIELNSETQTFAKPNWIGKEVSEDPKYFNSNLIKNPFKRWK